MAQELGGRDADRGDRELLAIAKQFREAASGAGRADVVAKIDEAILLLAEARDVPTKANEKTNLVLRILDGFGF